VDKCWTRENGKRNRKFQFISSAMTGKVREGLGETCWEKWSGTGGEIGKKKLEIMTKRSREVGKSCETRTKKEEINMNTVTQKQILWAINFTNTDGFSFWNRVPWRLLSQDALNIVTHKRRWPLLGIHT